MGTDQQRAASRSRGAAWPAAHADRGEHVSRTTRVDIAGPERGLRQQLGLRVAGAGLLAAAGAIHLDLYLTGYRTIPTIGWLFLLQVIVAFVLAVAVAISGGRMVAAVGTGFAVATLGGYIASVWAGLFGFTEVRTTAGIVAGIVAGIIETAAFAALAAVALAPAAERRPAGPQGARTPLPARPGAGLPGGRGGGRGGVGYRPDRPGRLRRPVRQPGTGGRGRPEDREDRRRDRAGERQRLHALLVHPRYPGQVELQRVVRRVLAAGHRHPGRRPRHHRPARHHQALRRLRPGHL